MVTFVVRNQLRLSILAGGLVLMTSSACSMNKLAVNLTAPALEEGMVAFDRDRDLQFSRDAFPGDLRTVEILLASSPKNKHLLFVLARGFNAFSLILEQDLDRARISGSEQEVDKLSRRAAIHYLNARDYAFRWLDKPELHAAAMKGDLASLTAELQKLKKRDVGPVFWALFGWASAINLSQNDPAMVGSLPVIEKLIARVVELDPDYENGLPLLFQGVYYASRPPMFGGDPEKSEKNFQRAMHFHGKGNLLIPYMYARFLTPLSQNRKLFDELLNQVLTTDLNAYPNTRLTNELARSMALFWQSHADELFLE